MRLGYLILALGLVGLGLLSGGIYTVTPVNGRPEVVLINRLTGALVRCQQDDERFTCHKVGHSDRYGGQP